MNDFLPKEYEAPSGSNSYMKLQKENKIRILSKPIIGWQAWKDKKPHRFTMNEKPDGQNFDQPVKHFWAFIVWNYNEQAIQILELTQATIQKPIMDLSKDQEWGPPYEYDIKITKKGEGMDTEYSVTPSPKKSIAEEIKKAALEKPCHLEALYAAADPWIVTDKQTDLAFLGLPF